MNLNLINSEFYNTYADSFDKIPFEEILTKLVSKHIIEPSQILEIGSGAGALACWLSGLGHEVTCIEPAEKPAKKAIEKGLIVKTSTFQDYQITHQFDYIFAISSFIHLQRAEIPFQIKRVSVALKEEGILFISFIEGNGEGYEDPTNTGKLRFFSKFSLQELEKLVSHFFTILELYKIEVKKMKQEFLLFVLKKR